MKSLSKLLIAVAAIAATPFALQAATAPAVSLGQRPAASAAGTLTVITLQGSATALVGGKPTPLNLNDTLPVGTKITLSQGSKVVLLTSDGNQIILAGDGEVLLNQVNGQLQLAATGNISTTASVAPNTAPVSVSNNGTIATIPAGSTGSVSTTDGATRAIAASGSLTVNAPGQPAQTVPAGSGTSVTPSADGTSSTVVPADPTPAEIQAITQDVNDAKNAATASTQPTIPAGQIQDADTLPSNPDQVVSGADIP